MKLMYQGSSGFAIFEDYDQSGYPYIVGHDGLVTKESRFDRLTGNRQNDQEFYDSCAIQGRFPTYWRALIDVLERDGYSREDAINEAGRRELDAKRHQNLTESETERLKPMVNSIRAAMPHGKFGVPLYDVGVDHLGGGIFAVGISNLNNDAYVLVTDLDGFPMVGFYKDHEDEEGVMLEPLGHQDAPLDSERGRKAVVESLRTLDQFFKRPHND